MKFPAWPSAEKNARTLHGEASSRVRPLEETRRMARALADTVGISRIGEITQLDVLGVPCFMAVRPRADMIDENISVYVGKGLTPLEAEVSTLMEAVERHCGERRGRPLRLSSFRDLSRVATCVHPARLPLADACGYRE
ncbi:hypothetical protein F9K50_12335 [bacterium]|nr:MAG: hypothetical protein F9K50_12335 [bacterium]